MDSNGPQIENKEQDFKWPPHVRQITTQTRMGPYTEFVYDEPNAYVPCDPSFSDVAGAISSPPLESWESDVNDVFRQNAENPEPSDPDSVPPPPDSDLNDGIFRNPFALFPPAKTSEPGVTNFWAPLPIVDDKGLSERIRNIWPPVSFDNDQQLEASIKNIWAPLPPETINRLGSNSTVLPMKNCDTNRSEHCVQAQRVGSIPKPDDNEKMKWKLNNPDIRQERKSPVPEGLSSMGPRGVLPNSNGSNPSTCPRSLEICHLPPNQTRYFQPFAPISHRNVYNRESNYINPTQYNAYFTPLPQQPANTLIRNEPHYIQQGAHYMPQGPHFMHQGPNYIQQGLNYMQPGYNQIRPYNQQMDFWARTTMIQNHPPQFKQPQAYWYPPPPTVPTFHRWFQPHPTYYPPPPAQMLMPKPNPDIANRLATTNLSEEQVEKEEWEEEEVIEEYVPSASSSGSEIEEN